MVTSLLTLVFSFISLSAFAQVAEQVKIAEIMIKKKEVGYSLNEVVFNLPNTKTLTIGTYPDTKPNEVVLETSATGVSFEYVSNEILTSQKGIVNTFHRIVYRVGGISDVKYLVIHKKLKENNIFEVSFFNKDNCEDTDPTYTRLFAFNNVPTIIIEKYAESFNTWTYKGNINKLGVEFTLKSSDKKGYEIKATKF